MAAELFRYHAWANRRLIDFCVGLEPSRLAARSATAYGSIHETLAHLVGAEGSFVNAILGERVIPPLESAAAPTLAELAERADRTGAALAEAAARIPPDRPLTLQRRGEPRQLPAASVFATALYHAGEHRAQVVAILHQRGIRPPDLSGWAFGGDRSGDYA